MLAALLAGTVGFESPALKPDNPASNKLSFCPPKACNPKFAPAVAKPSPAPVSPNPEKPNAPGPKNVLQRL